MKTSINKDKKVIFSNFIALSFLQLANLMLPVISLPYLVKTLGPEKFGLLMFAQAVMIYFTLLTDYGFNFTATREISINKNNNQKIIDIFSSVITVKLLLLLLSFLILIFLVNTFNFFYINKEVYYLTFGIVIGQMIFPIWLFQGLEKMKYITYINVFTKILFTIGIFIFIQSPDDYMLLPLFNSLSYIVSGIIGLLIVTVSFKIKFIAPAWLSVKNQFFSSGHMFISTASMSLYTTSNIFLLGLLTNNTIVGYYSAVEKLITAIRSMYAPFNQAIFPYFMRIFQEDKNKSFKLLNRIALIGGVVLMVISFSIFQFSDLIVELYFGFSNDIPDRILKILCFVPIFTFLGSLFLINAMSGLKLDKLRNKIIIRISILYLICLPIIIYNFSYQGLALLYLFIEMVITLISIYIVKKELSYA